MKKKNLAIVLCLVVALVLLAGCKITPMLPKYKLTISILPDNTAGSVNPPSGSQFTVETEVVLVPTANTGWVFDHWEGPNASDVILQGDTWKIVMNKHKSLTAVFKSSNQAPTVSLVATPLTGSVPLEVSFTATASDPNNDPMVFDWEFGDGATKTNGGKTQTHNYQVSGNFVAKVTAKDDKGLSATAEVTINVMAANNHNPVATDDAKTISEDEEVDIDVLANDTDEDADPLTIGSVTEPSHGAAAISDGKIHYIPTANYFGSDSFTYTIQDGRGGTSTGTVNLTITPVNDAPVAVNDIIQLPEEGTILIDVLANDTDVDGDSLTLESFTQGTSGTVTQENNKLRYAPNADFAGGDYFTYVVNDGNGATAEATVVVTIEPVNDAPVAEVDTTEVDEDGTVLINVLANDTDPDGDELTIVEFTQGSKGEVVKEGTSLRYTPVANFNGSDSFTYKVSDGQGGVDTASVTVTVRPVNDAPVALDDAVEVAEDSNVVIEVLTNDSDLEGDVITILSFTQGSYGTVSKETTTLRYTPVANFNGSDSFSYTINDAAGATCTATVNVTVTPVNDAPVAQNDSAALHEGGTTLIAVLANDSDIDGDTLTITSFTQGTNGTVAQEGDSLRYTVNGFYNGSDQFTYTVSDGKGGTAIGTVNLTIDSVNDAPVATDDSVTVDEDQSILIDVLGNDSDLESDPLTISEYTQPGHGAVVKEGTNLRYTPVANYNGSDSFTYTISDGHGGEDTGTVTITVNAVNDAPVAQDNTAQVNEDESVLIDVLANDSDIDGDVLVINSFVQGSYGTVTQEGDLLRYAPQENYNGSDSFTYTVSDGNGGTASANVTITVNAANDAPVATDDTIQVNEDSNILINVLANDTDVEGDVLTITSFTQGGHGSVVKEGNSLRYTPAANYNGADSFTYDISDDNGGSATGTVNVTVNPTNDMPVAVNDSAVTDEDTSVLIDVLANDTDLDGDTLTVSSFTQGAHGTVAQEGDSLRYTPAANYNGADSFTYQISDGNGGTASATVNITVTSVNDVPVANNDSQTLYEDASVLVDVLVNDTDVEGDTLSITSFTQGAHGAVAQEGDSLRYTPIADYNGADSFTYNISDGIGGTATATVNITVNLVNDTPVAANDSKTLSEDTTVLVDVLVNDTDVDGDTLSIMDFTQGAHGTVAQEGDSLRYTPAANYYGADSFTYEVSDGIGGTASATVNITVTSVNDAPVATNDSQTLSEDATVLVDVLVNDTDVEGNTLSITSFTQGAYGTVAQEGDSLRYTPDANYNGADSFTYNISDGMGGTATATVNITVNPINDTPVAANDSKTLSEDTTVLVDVLVNDTDVDGDTLSITGFTQGAHGTVAQEGDSLRYTPAANYYGADSFTYQISDGNGGTASATVNITITSVNDVPVANNDSQTLSEDATVLVDVLVNDTDAEGDTLSIASFTQGAHGSVAQEGDSLRYTPDANYNGADSFTYNISDGMGGTATATVNITVNPVNDAPTANSDDVSVDEDSSILIDVLANDTDIDGDVLSIKNYGVASHGTVSQVGNSLRYTPNANYYGADSFLYTAQDPSGAVSQTSVQITVNAVNDVPVAVDDTATVDQDSTILIDVLVNDTDLEGDTLTITSYSQGSHGLVSEEDNQIRYTPDISWTGTDTFTYNISDGQGGTSMATVEVTVNPLGSLLSMDVDHPAGNTDFISFTVTTMGNYCIQTSFYIQSCDTLVELYDAGMSMIASNDDYVDLYGCIASINLNPGTYYVKIYDFDVTHVYCHLEVSKL